MSARHWGEAEFVDALRALALHPAARGLGDDCAVLELGGEALVLTHDAMAEGVHFLAGQDMADVAWRLVATTLSDLAAKGAEPLGVLLGATLGDAAGDARFMSGLGEALAHYGAPLLGGDTISGGAGRGFGLTALGRATCRPVPSRGGARVGDALWICGTVGGAMVGFEALQAGSRDDALTLAYRRPRALMAEGMALAPHVTAMMDVSDGLLLDATRMARASGVTLAIDGGAVPLERFPVRWNHLTTQKTRQTKNLERSPDPVRSENALAAHARRDEALRWGDDYALLFTAPEGFVPPVVAARIGTVAAPGTTPVLLDGIFLNEDSGLGYEH